MSSPFGKKDHPFRNAFKCDLAKVRRRDSTDGITASGFVFEEPCKCPCFVTMIHQHEGGRQEMVSGCSMALSPWLTGLQQKAALGSVAEIGALRRDVTCGLEKGLTGLGMALSDKLALTLAHVHQHGALPHVEAPQITEGEPHGKEA